MPLIGISHGQNIKINAVCLLLGHFKMKRGMLFSSFFLKSESGRYVSQSFFILCRNDFFRMYNKTEDGIHFFKCEKVKMKVAATHNILR